MIEPSGNSFASGQSLLFWITAGMAFFTGLVSANPTGGIVQSGNITITDVAGLTTITQGDMRGIVNWQDFSIGALETTRFIQPSSSAATLNRVTGGLPSNIHGALEANGHVFLINPNGVLVGANGRVNTAGFAASALDVPDGEFLGGGDMTFSGPSLAGVVNLGTITASHGDVVLMARTVENEGAISAPNGTAAMAAGNEIFFKPSGNDRVVVKSASSGSGGGVRNSGTIEAAQAELKAAGGNTNGLAVNNSGIVRATGISRTKSGRVRLSAGGRGGSVVNTGRVSARNADNSGGEVSLDGGSGGSAINEGVIDASAKEAGKVGGTVEVLGDTITIGNGSVIDVSGSNGGLVAIGISALKATQATHSGGIATLAQGPDARAAQQVMIHSGSSILANSTDVGNGGKIISWAENRSVIGGVLEVKGGEFGGDGGLIETSAYRGLIITPDTQISALAPAGKAGTWLIDPIYNIRIVAGLGVTNNQDAPGLEPNGDDSIIGATLIVNQLNAGTDVTISTTSAFGPTIGTGTQAGNINVEGAIQKTAGGAAKLTLNAVGAVNLLASIAGAPLPSNLSVEINAGAGGVTQNALAVLAAKDLTITTIDGGSVTLNGAVLADTLSVNIDFNFINFPNFLGSVTINNPLNEIGTINRLQAMQGITLMDKGNTDGLIINGFVSGGGNLPTLRHNVILRTKGNFTITPSVAPGDRTISSNALGDIFIEADNGFFINNSGVANVLNPSVGSGGGFAVYSKDSIAPFVDGDFVILGRPDPEKIVTVPGAFSTADINNPVDINNSANRRFYFTLGGSGGGGGGGSGFKKPSLITSGPNVTYNVRTAAAELERLKELSKYLLLPPAVEVANTEPVKKTSTIPGMDEYLEEQKITEPVKKPSPFPEWDAYLEKTRVENPELYERLTLPKPYELKRMEDMLIGWEMALPNVKRGIEMNKAILRENTKSAADIRADILTEFKVVAKALGLGSIPNNVAEALKLIDTRRDQFYKAEAQAQGRVQLRWGDAYGLAAIYKLFDEDMAYLKKLEQRNKSIQEEIASAELKGTPAIEQKIADLRRQIAEYPWPPSKAAARAGNSGSGTGNQPTTIESNGQLYGVDKDGNRVILPKPK